MRNWWRKLKHRIFGHEWIPAQPHDIWEKVYCAVCWQMAHCGNCVMGILHEAYDYGFVIEEPTVESFYLDHGGEA